LIDADTQNREGARSLLGELEEAGSPPLPGTFLLALQACVTAYPADTQFRAARAALILLEEMRAAEKRPDSVHYATAAAALGAAKDW
jgi:hypothetical protein